MVDFSCALKLAMPLAVLSAMREAGREHITVKGGKFLEKIAQADTCLLYTSGRKSVLTTAGKRTAQQLLHQRKILEQYMQYRDIPPAQIKENALRALSAGFSDEFMDRLAEQEGRMRLKEIFAGHRDFQDVYKRQYPKLAIAN